MKPQINRRQFIKFLSAGAASLALPGCAGLNAGVANEKKPNFIVIFCDDMGYGDLT
ncbi:MAG: twin-arginine translocation signal domain-containing protein, partial [Planctomycetes bacterium]|nr:twin-arginine translocation signal domain-containing protein [Planctomycetota bacterium]